MKRLLLASALLFAVSAAGCGFQPVYAPSSLSGGALSPVAVDEIPGRSGYILRRALQQELAIGLPGLSEAAALNVDLDESLTRLSFQPDGAASRSSVIARGKYVLTINDKTVGGLVSAETNFAVPDAPYGDITAQTSAADRAMRQLAKRIVADLRLKLAVAD
jgi:LPS-assembly lipoprotein